MADLKKNKQIDEILDSLLAQYSDVEPRSGLEQRILANLGDRARNETVPWWSVKWLWAGAAVAAVIIVAAVLTAGRRHVIAPIPSVVQTQQHAPQQPKVQRSLPTTASTVRHSRKPSVVAGPQNTTLALSQRPAIFPTPTPLSEQERLLFTYLSNTPQEVVVAQLQRTDQKEADAFWADHEPWSITRAH